MILDPTVGSADRKITDFVHLDVGKWLWTYFKLT